MPLPRCAQTRAQASSWGKDSPQRGGKPGRNSLVKLVFSWWAREVGLRTRQGGDEKQDGAVIPALISISLTRNQRRSEKNNLMSTFLLRTESLVFRKQWNQAVSHNKFIKKDYYKSPSIRYSEVLPTFVQCFQTKLMHAILCNSLYNNCFFKSCFFSLFLLMDTKIECSNLKHQLHIHSTTYFSRESRIFSSR